MQLIISCIMKTGIPPRFILTRSRGSVKKQVFPLWLSNRNRQNYLMNRRAGTEKISGIIGLATALDSALRTMNEAADQLRHRDDPLISGVLASVPYTRLNRHPTRKLPGNVNMSVEFVEGESILHLLDRVGICASTGSACTSGSLEPSHVLMAPGSHKIEGNVPALFSHGERLSCIVRR
jgi:cysteine sulfinate desulfinase/cysteine desulfurase-like protein